jgi:hypothetical protein
VGDSVVPNFPSYSDGLFLDLACEKAGNSFRKMNYSFPKLLQIVQTSMEVLILVQNASSCTTYSLIALSFSSDSCVSMHS